MASSLLQRPLDLMIVFIFINFIVIALTIDFTQSTYGAILELDLEKMEFGLWPPESVVRLYAWWCETVDPMVGHNPMWYETMAWYSPFIYVPFYFVAIYAFIYEREWIRIPTLMWGWGLLLTMGAVVREELYGVHATKDVRLFFLAYSAYIMMPVIVMLRVAWAPVFSVQKAKEP